MEGDLLSLHSLKFSPISIHTLRVEGDSAQIGQTLALFISIHTLRVEGDKSLMEPFRVVLIFQSTPSAWRVTLGLNQVVKGFAFQSTPSAWRVTVAKANLVGSLPFQSTPSAWRVTFVIGTVHDATLFISIHTLRVEGDV